MARRDVGAKDGLGVPGCSRSELGQTCVLKSLLKFVFTSWEVDSNAPRGAPRGDEHDMGATTYFRLEIALKGALRVFLYL